MNKIFEQTKKAASKARQASISNLNAASNALSQASGANIKLTTAKTDEELKRLLKEVPVLFSGSVWKRRGGLGKLASYSSAWETRHLQLRGTVILYFESDPSKALSSSNDPQELLRGYIDLAEEKAIIQASFGHSGAPSPFCLSIKVPVGLAQETKWKLCFDHHETQIEWLTAISDVIIQCSVDSYNMSLLEAANPSSHGGESTVSSSGGGGGGLLRSPPVYEPGAKDKTKSLNKANSFKLVGCPHQLWMMDNYTVTKKTTESKEQQAKTKASVDTALQVMERLLAEERNQRAIANRDATELKGKLETAQQGVEASETKMAKAVAEKQSLQEELAIRISTHDLVGDGKDETEIADNETDKLKAQLAQLTQKLESKANVLQQVKDEKEAAQSTMQQRVEQLETKLDIAQSEHEETLAQAKKEAGQQLGQSDEVNTLRQSMGEQVASLEKKLLAAKAEYQESLQTLAADFAQKLEAIEEKYKASSVLHTGGTAPAAPKDEGDSSILRRSEDSAENDEFEDCMESYGSS